MTTAAQGKEINSSGNSRFKGGLNADRPIMLSEIFDILNGIVNLTDYLKADGSTPMTGLLTLSGDPSSNLNPVTLQFLNGQITALINGAPVSLNTLGELANAINNDPAFATTITTELSNIKNYEFKVLYYESINTTTGTISKPTNTDIILSDFPSGLDAVVETIVNGEPTGQIAKTAGGVPITVTSFDISGNYTLSGTPASTPIALLYVLKVKAQYLSNLTFDNIIETANFNLTTASDLAFTPNGDISSTNVQNAIVEVRDDTDVKLSNKQPLDSDLTTIAAINAGTGNGVLASDGSGWIYKTYSALKTALSLNNVDNTSDATKNATVATLTNKTLTSPVINSPTGIVKGDVGLGNVDNTSDVNKPVSTAQASADAVVLASAASDATTKANAAKAYADGLVIGLWDDRGSFNASVNAYPSSGGSGAAGAILKGDVWTVSVAGTLPTSQVVEIGDIVRALVDTPGNTQANWSIQQNNIGYTAENSANKDTDVTLASNSDTKYPSQKAIKTYVDTSVAAATIPDATPTVKGKAKLYSDVTGNNTDGAPDQNSVKVALATKQNSLGYTAENIANKDATGGYVGLTLFKINFKNALNTITSFFTNANTVARTYTFQDRNGTIADDTDLGLKADKVSITGATKTKVTYNAQGIVTSGADATTADIADSTNKRYQTDNQQTYNDATSSIQTQLNAKESVSNKATDFTVVNNTLYPTTQAVRNEILSQLATLSSKPDVQYASTNPLPTYTYNNGSSGVGATWTGDVNGPLIVDGVTILVAQVGQKFLIAGESSGQYNGWATLTQVGVIAVSPYILTRDTQSDTSSEIGAGYLTGVVANNSFTAGSNNGKVFISIAPDPFTVGTSVLTFSQVGGTYTNGNGISLTGSTFSIDLTITVDKTTAQTLTNKTLTSPVINSPTGIVKGDVGLGNVDNTSDVNKPVSTAQASAIALKEATANKDATGGYVGLTLFKINFKNAANTFTSFFTNSNTASRQYVFKDRSGTILDDTDYDSLNTGKQDALGYTAENTANKDTDGTLTANSDTKYASQKATKTYADTKLTQAQVLNITTLGL